MTDSQLDPSLRSALAQRAARFHPSGRSVEVVLRRAHRRQRIRRMGTTLVVLGLFVASMGLLLPRLLRTTDATQSAAPALTPSATDEGGNPQPNVFFPTLTREVEGYPDWGIGGPLVEEGGCIFLRQTDGFRWLILWPHGWSVERVDGGALRILDDTETPVVDVGETVSLPGGGVGQYPRGPPEKFAEELIGSPIPAPCLADGYFMTPGPEAETP